MNKTKMILAGTGGAIGVVVLALGFLVWQAFSAKTAAIEGDYEEGVDGLESVDSQAQSLSRKPVYPSAASVAAIEANQKTLDDWRKEGLSLAARGDKIFPKTTPAQFKTDLVADAKRLMALPGAVQGKLVKPDFAFGPFKDYIVEGKMPAEAELADLQRKWDDVATVTELLAANGIAELVDVQFKSRIVEATKSSNRTSRRVVESGKGRTDRARSAKSAIRGFDRFEDSTISHSYVFTFAARPSAFVNALNELEKCERFVSVDDFSFARPGDVIAEALGGDEKKAEGQASGRRGRRGRRGNAEAASAPLQDQEKPEGKNGIVTDPLSDAPMTVTMTVTVHDFRSLEDSGEATSSPLQKGASK